MINELIIFLIVIGKFVDNFWGNLIDVVLVFIWIIIDIFFV